MRAGRAILALRYTPVSVAGGVRKAVGGFLRYVQHRDQHVDADTRDGFDAYTRYVTHRDHTSPQGRVFGRDSDHPELDRKRLVEYVARSTQGLAPTWVKGRDGKLEDRQRAVYTFVLSPEDWRGLDLRRLARAAMAELDQTAGGLGPWFAAEHRNTAHHHVHVVLAARREVAPGRYRTVLITRPRLERMKEAMRLEMARQRGLEHEPARIARTRAARPVTAIHPPKGKFKARGRQRFFQPVSPVAIARRPRATRHQVAFSLSALGSYYRWQMQRDLEHELRSREFEGWMR